MPLNRVRRLLLGGLAFVLGNGASLAQATPSGSPDQAGARSPRRATIKPRHVLCFLGRDRDLRPLSDAASRTIHDFAPGFRVDDDYSKAKPDDRMSPSFQVCWDRVAPHAWTAADEVAIANHQSVLYVLGPSMEQSDTVDVSMTALRLIERLIDAGAVAVKGESAGIAHGLDRWRELIGQAMAAQNSADKFARQRICRLALARRPLSSDGYLSSVGFHLVGLPDVSVPGSRGSERDVVAIIDAVAEDIAAHGLEQTLKDRSGTLSFVSAYEEDSFKFNPYGNVLFAK